MKSYEKYKESGVEWLGEIPEHWINQRIDWITALVRGNTGFKKDELLDQISYSSFFSNFNVLNLFAPILIIP